MDKNRVIAMIMFSFSAAIVWGLFIMFMSQGDTDKLLIIGGLISAVVAASIISYWLSPKIYKAAEERRRNSFAASYGMVIIFLSYLLGSIVFGFGSTIFALIIESSYNLNIQSIQGLILTIIVGFLTSITYMSPGFLLGAATGMAYLEVVECREAED